MHELTLKKLRSRKGASLTFALLAFLVCAVISAVLLAAAQTAAGRVSGQAEADQRYYAVSSAAKLFCDALGKESQPFRIEWSETVTTGETTVTVEKEDDGSYKETETPTSASALSSPTQNFEFRRGTKTPISTNPMDEENLGILAEAAMYYAFGERIYEFDGDDFDTFVSYALQRETHSGSGSGGEGTGTEGTDSEGTDTEGTGGEGEGGEGTSGEGTSGEGEGGEGEGGEGEGGEGTSGEGTGGEGAGGEGGSTVDPATLPYKIEADRVFPKEWDFQISSEDYPGLTVDVTMKMNAQGDITVLFKNHHEASDKDQGVYSIRVDLAVSGNDIRESISDTTDIVRNSEPREKVLYTETITSRQTTTRNLSISWAVGNVTKYTETDDDDDETLLVPDEDNEETPGDDIEGEGE